MRLPVRNSALQAQAEADANGLVNLFEVGGRQVADLAVEANLVNGVDLRKQDSGVFFQPGHAAGNMDVDRIVFREALRGERRHNDGRRSCVSHVVLDHDDRPAARLL